MPETPEIPELPLAEESAANAEAMASAHKRETAETAHLAEPMKESEPMLDVHPAPHAANTLRDFFIHIATIVLGLLIAVGLEQTVEYVHHRRELTQARKELSDEKEANVEGFRRSAASFQAGKVYLDGYLATLRQSMKDPAVLLPPLKVPVGFVFSQYTAWNTAQRNGALTLMPSEEQRANDHMYVSLHAVDESQTTAYRSVRHAAAVFRSGLDPKDLTLEQKKQLYRDASEALDDIEGALIVQRVTLRFNPEFGDERSPQAKAGRPTQKP